MVLVGAWESGPLAADESAIFQRLGTDRESVTDLCKAGKQAGVIRAERRRWAPVGESGQGWSWVDHWEAFRHLAPLVRSEDWDRFAEVVSYTHLLLGRTRVSVSMLDALDVSVSLGAHHDREQTESPLAVQPLSIGLRVRLWPWFDRGGPDLALSLGQTIPSSWLGSRASPPELSLIHI